MPSLRPFFTRSEDLTIDLRMRIALFFRFISSLSDKYSISRQFIYDLRRDFQNYGELVLQSDKTKGHDSEKLPNLSWILSPRFEGKSSI